MLSPSRRLRAPWPFTTLFALAACGGQTQGVHPEWVGYDGSAVDAAATDASREDASIEDAARAPDAADAALDRQIMTQDALEENPVLPLGPTQCRAPSDCVQDMANLCISPGAMLPCGVCQRVSACSSDTDCEADGGAQVCDAVTCPCPPVQKACTTGCGSAADCKTGQSCNQHHCVATACMSDADCPVDFACSGTCARKACAVDADCSAYCVNGACYGAPGQCEMAPP